MNQYPALIEMVDTQSLELGYHGFGLLLFNTKVHQGLGLSSLYVQLRFHPESMPLRDVLSPYRIREYYQATSLNILNITLPFNWARCPCKSQIGALREIILCGLWKTGCVARWTTSVQQCIILAARHGTGDKRRLCRLDDFGLHL